MRAPVFLKFLAAAGLLLALVPAGFAQTKASTPATPPGPAPAKEIRFPAFQQKTLNNSLRVVVIEQHEQPLVSLRLMLNAGKAYEPDGKAGLAEATASLLTKGTPTRSAQQLAQTIDFVGGHLDASAGTEAGYASASVTSDQLDLGFELLADVVLHPTFPQEELERWRKQAINGLQINLQDASYVATTASTRLIFGGYPYGRPSGGTPTSLAGLTRDDLAAFHKQHYIPNQTILAIVGDVRPEDAFARAERAFGSWEEGRPSYLPDFDVEAPKKTRIVVIDKPDAVQTEIRLGQVGLAYRDPARFTAEVYNSVLGGNASARLYEEIRRKRGLSYGASSYFLEETQPGFFQISTFTKTETTADALGLAFDVLRGLQEKPVPEPELKAAKTYITGAFPLEIETADGIASKVLEAMHFGFGREFLESYNDRISKVSAADVQGFAARSIRPEWMTAVLVGNASAFTPALKKKYGEVEVIPVSEVDFLQPDLRRPKPAAPAASQPAAVELLKKAQAALGGPAFTGQKTLVSKGTATMSGPNGSSVPVPSIVSYDVLPAKTRLEMATPGGQLVQTFNGTEGWVSFNNRTRDTTQQAKQEHSYGINVLRHAGEAGYTAHTLPDAEVNGKPAKAVEVADAEGHSTRFFLDPQTGLVSKVAFAINGQAAEIAYTDYREVNGVKVAFQENVFQDGQQLLEVKYTDVQVNAPVDEKLFQKPQG
jgi:zinc protease